MRYHYIAFEPSGKVNEGNIEAKDPAEVLTFLARRGLRPITVKPITLAVSKSGGRIIGEKITITDKIFLTKYLALMLKVGTDLFHAIDILIADFDKRIIKALLVEIRGSLERGQPFYSTFARYPQYFSLVFVNLVKAGESSGNLDKAFEDLSVALTRENELRTRIRAALIYPVLLLILAVIILTFLVTFALPRIADVFSGGGIEPPGFSRVVFAVGLFLGKYIWGILLVGASLLITAGFFFFKTKPGKKIFSQVLNFIPLVKGIIKKIAMQRFAATLSSLLRSGLPIIVSLEITADAVGHEQLASSLRRIAREGVARGVTIGDAFKREPVFPNVVANLVAVSEKAGHLDEILQTLGNFYELEIDNALKTLVSFLEPALLLVIGLVVAVIALAIIVPIYQLVGQF